jgi:glycosyltransferase involved in cell wall biosynthesis
MSSGVPVVAVNEGGVKENLIDGKNGLAFEVGSCVEMAGKIEILLCDEKLRSELASNARMHALKRSWGQVFDVLFDDYKEDFFL